MTEKDFKFLENLYLKAKQIRKEIEDTPGDDPRFIELKIEFDELDAIEELVNNTSQKIRLFDEKIYNIRNYVMHKTNGMIDLPKDIIIGIIEKSLI